MSESHDYRLRRDAGPPIALDRDLTTLGRSPDNHVVVTDPSASRRHAVIQREGNEYWIEDVGAQHGTWVNDDRVIERVALVDGDVIYISGARFVFELEPEPTQRMNPRPEKRPITGMLEEPGPQQIRTSEPH
jgi:pSer/pThr/pTyr-binding forkhead associated (FHA) protein